VGSRREEPPTVKEDGRETHPGWGVIGAYRTTTSGGPHGGATLFDSDLSHSNYIVVRLHRAERERSLNRDWIHEDGRQSIVEIAMSEAQWASFVSSMNTTGVPCTIHWTEKDGPIPGFPHEPRLRESIDEVQKASTKALAEITQAEQAVAEAFERNAGKKEMRSLLSTLHYAIRNAPSNMTFAASSLTEHAENVVQRARADVEAMVLRQATAMGIEPGDLQMPQLGAGGQEKGPVDLSEADPRD
jgi:hypothetical protein